jgi:hypothetical protein
MALFRQPPGRMQPSSQPQVDNEISFIDTPTTAGDDYGQPIDELISAPEYDYRDISLR